jgi:hypothetical protein
VTINGVAYENQSGIHYDRFTDTYPAQSAADGALVKFNQFAGNTWAIDSLNPFKGSERVEFSGNPAKSRARFPGPESTSIWISDAIYVEKGDPTTTDWTTLGQIHDRVGVGPIFAISIRTGEYLTIDITTNKFVKTLGRMPLARGHWYRRVMNLKFNESSAGFIKVWIDGRQIVDYHGETGNADTQYYYWKFGIYRSHAPEYLAVRYANVRIGGEELAKKITDPDPIPTGFCTDNGSC